MKHSLRTVKMPSDKIQSTLDKHFSKTYPDGFHGYRGAKYTENSLFINPQKLTRTSKDTNNLYYVLMDNLPSYKNYPSRSKSIIFSNNKSYTELYGTHTFQVFPSNYAKIAVAEIKNDFIKFTYAFRVFELYDTTSLVSNLARGLNVLYTTHPHLNELKNIYDTNNIPQLKEWIVDMSSLLMTSLPSSDGFYKDVPRTLEFLQKINNTDYKQYIQPLLYLYGNDISYRHHIVLPYTFGEQSFMSTFLLLLETQGRILNILDDLFNPTKNDIQLMDVSQAKRLMSDPKIYELWTDSLCYLVRTKQDDINERVNYKDFYK